MEAENLTFVTEFILVGLSSHRRTQILLFVIIFLTYLFTVFGNLVIIMLIREDSQLHTPMYFFLTHLSGIEICYVTSTIPQTLAVLLAGSGTLSIVHCALQMPTALSLASSETLLLSVMAYDRYLAICHPLSYATAMGTWCQFQLASACWVSGFVISAICTSIIFHHPFCGSGFINHFICEVPMVLKLTCGDTHITKAIIFVFGALVLLGPFSVILISYGLILFSVLQMKSATRLHKALSTCSSHLAVVTLFYGPAIFLYLRPPLGRTSDYEKQLALFYVVVTPCLNPVIYTLRNNNVHAAMAKVLRKWGFEKKKMSIDSGPRGVQVANTNSINA